MVLKMPSLFNIFETSSLTGEGMGSDQQQAIIWNDVGVGIVPIGAIVAWAKSLSAGVPPLIPTFVECNGQVLADSDSPLNGVTIPNLNGGNRFLRGQTTSGTTSGSETHTHGVVAPETGQLNVGSGSSGIWHHSPNTAVSSQSTSTLPSYYEVVWVMRIK